MLMMTLTVFMLETASEKLLGIVINNNLSWKKHLYGDKDNPELKQRVGTLRRLSKYSWGLTLDTGSSQVIVIVSSSKAPASSTPCGRMQYVVTQTTDHLASSFAFSLRINTSLK